MESKVLDRQMKELETQYAEFTKQIRALETKRGELYEKMKMIAQMQGRAATKKPNPWDEGDRHLNHLRECAYLELHPEECSHATTRYTNHDGPGTPPYEKCTRCKRRITAAMRAQMVDI